MLYALAATRLRLVAAAEGVAAEAAAVAAAVESSPLGGLVYFPTALVRDQLPVGLDELGGVPSCTRPVRSFQTSRTYSVEQEQPHSH